MPHYFFDKACDTQMVFTNEEYYFLRCQTHKPLAKIGTQFTHSARETMEMAHSNHAAEPNVHHAVQSFLQEESSLLSNFLPSINRLRMAIKQIQMDIAQGAQQNSFFKEVGFCLGSVAGLTISLAFEITEEHPQNSQALCHYLLLSSDMHEEISSIARHVQRLYRDLNSRLSTNALMDLPFDFERDANCLRRFLVATQGSPKLAVTGRTQRTRFWADAFKFVFADLGDALLDIVAVCQKVIICQVTRPGINTGHFKTLDESIGSSKPKYYQRAMPAQSLPGSKKFWDDSKPSASTKRYSTGSAFTIHSQDTSHTNPKLGRKDQFVNQEKFSEAPPFDLLPRNNLRERQPRRWVEYAMSASENNTKIKEQQSKMKEQQSRIKEQQSRIEEQKFRIKDQQSCTSQDGITTEQDANSHSKAFRVFPSSNKFKGINLKQPRIVSGEWDKETDANRKAGNFVDKKRPHSICML